MYVNPNYANSPQGYFVHGMSQPPEHGVPRVGAPIPGGMPPGAFVYNQPGPQQIGPTYVSIPPNQPPPLPPPRMHNPNGYGANGNGPPLSLGGYNQSATSQASSNGSVDSNSPTNASVQSNQPPLQPPQVGPPQQLPPNQVPHFPQIPVANPRFFNPQNPHMQPPPPIQQFVVPPPAVLPQNIGYQSMPGVQQQPATSQAGGPPPHSQIIRSIMYPMQPQPQFVNAQIPLHPQQMIPPPIMGARSGMPHQMSTRGFVPPNNYRPIMIQQQGGPRQLMYIHAANFVPPHPQMQGYIPSNAPQYQYRPDSRRSSTSYSRTQSESKFSDIKNEPAMSPDQQQSHLQHIPPAHTPQFYQMQDGYAIYQSPPSSTYDTANAGSGYQSPEEIMMGYPQQYYVGPPVSESYQPPLPIQQPLIEEERQQQFINYNDQKQQQQFEETNQVEINAQHSSESKISENYSLTHTEQNQHVEYEVRTNISKLNLSENANGPTCENSQNEASESANLDSNRQDWRKLDQIQEENAPNEMAASMYSEKAVSIECSYCRNSGEPESVYSAHSLLSSDGKIICSKLKESGCSICKAKGDDVHFERTCPQNEIPTPSHLQTLAQQIFRRRGHNQNFKPNGHSNSMRGTRGSFRGSRDRLDRGGGGGHQKDYKDRNYGGQSGYSQDSSKNYGTGIRKSNQSSYDGERPSGRREESGRGGGGRYDDGPNSSNPCGSQMFLHHEKCFVLFTHPVVCIECGRWSQLRFRNRRKSGNYHNKNTRSGE